MKKTVLALASFAVAAAILFQDYLPKLTIPLGSLVWFGILFYFFCHSLVKKSLGGSFLFGTWCLLLVNEHFSFTTLGNGSIILIGVFCYLGVKLLFQPNKFSGKPSYYRSVDGKKKVWGWTTDKSMTRVSSFDSDTVFGKSTRYINDEFSDVSGDTVFGTTTIYFDNANMMTDSAAFSGDAVFSSVTLYIPKNWHLEFQGDQVFSRIGYTPSGETTDKTLYITGDFVFSTLNIIFI
ncbi:MULTISPECIES: hypothetical protein [Streptococcus]|uniref:Cell wall-active antibiotics response LiaF-like C-terminal domain-containing protein n=1 Tax=Streptococcus caledonicus TaxID=2614158 RepID=A0ABW0UHV0_9STRE|nr:hypothetical protein [Streptococcus sp. S784/96/1]